MFRGLGPDAQGLLGVVAFFLQGVDEENISWLFPTISNGSNMFDHFRVLSLTCRSNGFVTMLALLQDYLRPEDPVSSVPLCAAKESYFVRLSADVYPDHPGFKEARWITSEDVNVEHLLSVFTSVDANSRDIWEVCARFMDHLYWHKPRLVVLGPKIEALPDDHPSKAQCLQELPWLFHSVGNQVERKRLLTHTLKLWRERGDERQVALTLSYLSGTSRGMGLYKQGIQQAREASEIFGGLGDMTNKAGSLIDLAASLRRDGQLNAAEEAAYTAINLLLEKGEEFLVCQGHRVLGNIYRSKGDKEKAIHHFEVALGIVTSLNAFNQLFWVHFTLSELFCGERRFDDAHAHI